MKLGKKLMGCAIALAVFSMIGCALNADDHGIIDFDAPGGKASIDYNNKDVVRHRGWKTFNTKHTTANCVISISTESDSQAGNMGFIFGLNKHKDDTPQEDIVYDFYLVSFQYDSSKNNNIRYYVSYFENVGKDYLDGTGNFCDKNGVEIEKNGCLAKETKIDPTSSDTFNVSTSKVEAKDGFYNIYVSLTLDKDYGYVLNAKANSESGSNIFSEKTFTHGLNDTDHKTDGKWDNKKIQFDLGAYAMVAVDKTLKGTWTFTEFTNSLDAE